MSSTPAAGYDKPLPMITPENERYWQGARDHELWLRNCRSCNRTYFYPRDICPDCGGRDVEWKQVSGRATLHTFAIVHRAPSPAFREMAPYVTAIVDLEEGGRMMTNLVDVEPDPARITVGMPLRVTFDDVTPEVTLPKFRPADA
jgi:uncharacterized OB-fold protein